MLRLHVAVFRIIDNFKHKVNPIDVYIAEIYTETVIGAPNTKDKLKN